jgi:hypothetical protein
VAGHDHAASFASKAAEQRHQLRALPWVETGQRLVQDEHGRVVHDCLRDLDTLAHSLRVRGEPAAVGRVEGHGLQRGRRRARGVRHGLEPGRQCDELQGGQRLEHVLLLRDETDLPRNADLEARIAAEDANASLRGAREPAEHAEHGRLTRSVRPEQRGHPRADVDADVRDRNQRAEPLGDPICDDAGLGPTHRNASMRR